MQNCEGSHLHQGWYDYLLYHSQPRKSVKRGILIPQEPNDLKTDTFLDDH